MGSERNLPPAGRLGSRRGFLRLAGLAALAGPAAGLAACSGDSRRLREPRVDSGGSERDTPVLNALLDVEYLAVAAYAEASRRVRGAPGQLSRIHLAHERAHAGELRRTIERLGGTPNPPLPEWRYTRELGPARSGRELLQRALDVEETAVTAYVDALPRLSSGTLRARTTTIIVAEGQHISLLLEQLGRGPAPEPFVGSEA